MPGPLTDAIKLIRARHHLDDLEAALALVGSSLRAPRPALARTALQAVEPGDAVHTRPEPMTPALFEDIDLEAEGNYNDDLVRSIAEAENTTVQIEARGTRRSGDTPDRGRPGPLFDSRRPVDPRTLEPRRVICSILEPARLVPPPSPPSYRSVPLPPSRPATGPVVDTIIDLGTLAANLYSLVKVPRPGTAPDLDAVLGVICRGEAISEVPLIPIRSAPFSLVVLVEQSLRLGPLARDVTLVLGALSQTLGRHRVRVSGFYTESDGIVTGHGPAWTWLPLREQRITEPILMISGPRDDTMAGALLAECAERERSGRPTRTILLGVPASRNATTWCIDD